MQRSSMPAVLSPAAQAANAERDGSVSPYLRDAATKLQAIDAMIREARRSVMRLQAHSDPQQKEAIEKIEARLIGLGNDAYGIRETLSEATPKYGQTLGKNGLSQFNAAARGDARSVVHQLDRQQRPLERMPGVLTPELHAAALGSAQVKPARNAAPVQRQHSSQTELGSEQVRNQQPKPVPRPTPEFAAGVDATKHRQEMAADSRRANERNEYLKSLASELSADRGEARDVQRTPTLDRS